MDERFRVVAPPAANRRAHHLGLIPAAAKLLVHHLRLIDSNFVDVRWPWIEWTLLLSGATFLLLV